MSAHGQRHIGVIGAGAMGLPIAARLHASGARVLVADPFPAALERVRDAGMTGTADPADAAACELVVVMVAAPAQLLSLLEAGPFEQGSAVRTAVVTATVGPLAIREFAERLAERGIDVLDAPVTGGVAGARDGTLTLMGAGGEAAIAHATSALAPVGSVRAVGTRPGDGQSVKLVNNLLSSVHAVAASEALRFARALDLDPMAIHPLLTSGAANSWMVGDRYPRMAQPRDEREFNTATAIFAKDTSLIGDTAQALGTAVPMLELARHVFQQAVQLGWEREDDSCIADLPTSATAAATL
ncbi:NAD(P)-dependent oxidoreductase [Agrococcus carbonis]|uniref:3-hydroxyisobutyrate dehydrogenase n=1 Tax=Agrococcus carbonis TaxID=684552 RepID=A0A1H1PT09_9MICO|nr:NAD(P)-dependent oxidoreductase [Agrococcus carbonis]SDS13859.1 3-hydroxyisobutyrate dehydrogenase [Agrococcus carbonis]